MDLVTVTVEQDTLTPAVERLPAALSSLLDAVARDTAHRLQAEVRARIRRQTAGTGQTEAAIVVEKIDGGYRVSSGNQGKRPAMLPIWLEYGTKHMHPRPAWAAAAALEEGTHRRRVEDAMQAAAEGLGA